MRRRIGFGGGDGPERPSIPRRLPGGSNGGPTLTPRKRIGTEDLGGGLSPGYPHGPGDHGGPHHGGPHPGDGKHWWNNWNRWGGKGWWSNWYGRGRGYQGCGRWSWYRPWYWCWPTYRYWSWCGSRWSWCWPSSWAYLFGCSWAYPSTWWYADGTGTTYVPTVVEPEPCPWSLAQAWGLIAIGNPEQALNAFDCLADTLPEDGQPLIGYALAASALGEQEYAISAMRDALRIDPASIGSVPDDERLREQVRQLMTPYDTRARTQYADVDALFMVAAMWYIVGEPETAGHALSVAMTLGDGDSSTLNLNAMIEEK